ncbi:MAG: glycoside hydrolase family 130 protein [Phycisphaeraceae bacterium]
MLERLSTHLLLSPSDMPPSSEQMRVVSVFNPGVIDTNDGVVMLVRVAEAVAQRRAGHVGLPRWDVSHNGAPARIVIDWVAQDDLVHIDPRVVEGKADGLTRLTFTSHLRVVRLGKDGRSVDKQALAEAPRFVPATAMETYGVEDPRISRLGDVYYFTYVAVSRHGACTAMASTTDFVRFKRHGVIFPAENKDVVLFPRKISGAYVALHRPNPRTHFARPEMWLAWSSDLVHWGHHQVLMSDAAPHRAAAGAESSKADWRIGRVGAGCPPVETRAGWLEIYHGNDKPAGSASHEVGAYVAAAVLIDRDNPRKVLAMAPEPIMRPEADFERTGFVPNVVFPTGIIERGDRYQVYYGAADACTGVVEWDKDSLLALLGQ